MELRQLRHFLVVAEELHFGRAAARLGIEQSPLSHSIKNLEADLNAKLFHRNTRRTWLTGSGGRYYEQVRRILKDLDAAAASVARGNDGKAGTIRVALGEDLASEPFTRLLFELEHHPSTPALEIRELTHPDAARLVRDGGTDVALTLDGRAEDGLQQFRAWSEPLVLVVPIGHRLAGKRSASLADMAGERLALPPSDACPGYLSQITEVLRGHGADSIDTVNVTHWNTAFSFVAAGRAVALFPRSLAIGNISVAVVPLIEDDAVLTTWLLYLGEEPSASASLVLALAETIASDAGTGREVA